MLTTSAAKIFLASQRAQTETELFRCIKTFSRGQQGQEQNEAFGSLYQLNDETLAGGQSLSFTVGEDSLILLLPVAGGIAVNDGPQESRFVRAGQAHLLYKQAGSRFEIQNPFEDELVNYLQLRFCCSGSEPAPAATFCFDIEGKRNDLVPLFPTINRTDFFLNAMIGKFRGRQEAIHPFACASHKAMAFVIEGAFELENRLLETRDGLAIWNSAQVEMEALSDNAIVLLIELG